MNKVTSVGSAATNGVKIFGIRAEPDDSGKNESIYPPRSESVGLCFVCTQRKVGLLCYLGCCLSKAHTSASFFPGGRTKVCCSFIGVRFWIQHLNMWGTVGLILVKRKHFTSKGPPWQRLSSVFKKFSLYEAMWLYLPQNIIFFLWLCPFNNNLALGIAFAHVLVLNTTSSFPNSASINRFP